MPGFGTWSKSIIFMVKTFAVYRTYNRMVRVSIHVPNASQYVTCCAKALGFKRRDIPCLSLKLLYDTLALTRIPELSVMGGRE